MLNQAKFGCQKPKTLQAPSISWEKGFSTEKEIFYFISIVLSKIVGY